MYLGAQPAEFLCHFAKTTGSFCFFKPHNTYSPSSPLWLFIQKSSRADEVQLISPPRLWGQGAMHGFDHNIPPNPCPKQNQLTTTTKTPPKSQSTLKIVKKKIFKLSSSSVWNSKWRAVARCEQSKWIGSWQFVPHTVSEELISFSELLWTHWNPRKRITLSEMLSEISSSPCVRTDKKHCVWNLSSVLLYKSFSKDNNRRTKWNFSPLCLDLLLQFHEMQSTNLLSHWVCKLSVNSGKNNKTEFFIQNYFPKNLWKESPSCISFVSTLLWIVSVQSTSQIGQVWMAWWVTLNCFWIIFVYASQLHVAKESPIKNRRS